MAARTAQNNRFKERKHASVRAFFILVHFFAVPFKTTTLNDEINDFMRGGGGEHKHATVNFPVSI